MVSYLIVFDTFLFSAKAADYTPTSCKTHNGLSAEYKQINETLFILINADTHPIKMMMSPT